MQKVISTKRAPGAIGPYSQAIEINNMVFTYTKLLLANLIYLYYSISIYL